MTKKPLVYLDTLEHLTLAQIRNKYNKMTSEERIKLLNNAYADVKYLDHLELTIDDLIIYAMGYCYDESVDMYKKMIKQD